MTGVVAARSRILYGMPYRLIDHDPAPEAVRHLTFLPFLPDGACVALPTASGGPRLPEGEVRPGEHYLLDTSARVPLETAGYYRQRVHPYAVDGRRVYAWLAGDRYTGRRPHATVELLVDTAGAIAARLDADGRPDQARAVRDGLRSYRDQDDAGYYADNVRLLEPAYLRGGTPQAGSGFGGDALQWRLRRELIVDGVDRDGRFLDLGCANGLLMESVARWAGERGHRIEPFGVDLAPGLVELARRRLPHWADRIQCGNAIDWRPADGRRFTFVHLLLDLVPAARRAALLRHALDALVEPGGRLLVSHYQARGGTDHPAGEHVRRLGFPVAGTAATPPADGSATTAWING